MNNLTIAEVVNFFRGLDLKMKIKVLHELTSALNNVIQEKPNKKEENEKDIIDEMFGMWKDEDELNEDSIINRTISDRQINLN